MTNAPPSPSVAVVGAGIAGATCARILVSRDMPVTLFEKARGVGGRAATRRDARGAFDHGAQFITAKDPDFEDQLVDWERRGVVAPWNGRFGKFDDAGRFRAKNPGRIRYVGTPGMNSIAKHLCDGLDVCAGVKVGAANRCKNGWALTTDDGTPLGTFHRVVLTAPAPQMAPLLGDSPLARDVEQIEFEPCWALMLEFAEALDLGFDGGKFESGPLDWIGRDSSKPGRIDGERWVVHASAGWSHSHLGRESEEVVRALLDVFPADLPPPLYAVAHRWRFARVAVPLGVGALSHDGLTVCGDGFLGGKIEAAHLSGRAAADSVLKSL